MKQAFKHKNYLITLATFVLTIILNYLSASGNVFRYSQKEISDMYANWLAPASVTFSIWGVIYIGMTVALLFPLFKKMSREDEAIYFSDVIPYFLTWTVFNILWTVTWNNDLIAIALVAIIGYALSLLRLTGRINGHRDFRRKYRWLLTFPVGLHTGWLLFASFTNVMVLLVKMGFPAFETIGIVVTILMMVAAVAVVLWAYSKNDNFAVTLPALWALVGIMIKQASGEGSTVVLIAAAVLLILALLGHVAILKRHRAAR